MAHDPTDRSQPWRSIRLAALCLALVGVAAAAFGVMSLVSEAASGNQRTDAGSTVAAEDELVERPECRTDHRTVAGLAARSVVHNVNVAVRPTALVRVDDRGEVVAALTNTGCAPRPTDDVYLVRPDGSVEPASTTAIADRAWQGDFRVTGTYVAQPAHG